MTKIILAGVAVIDFVLSVDGFPREAEKYRANDAHIVGGGCAANAAVTVSRLGGSAVLATRLGRDVIGDMIVEGLEAEGVDCSLARRFDGARSSFSSVLVDRNGERQIVNFRDDALPDESNWLEVIMPADVDAVLADTRWKQGAVTALSAARALSRPGILDAEEPLEGAEEALGLASHVAFSATGLRDLTGEKSIRRGLLKAREALRGFLCVTDGERGVYWIEGDAVCHIPAFKVETVDTLGAGDVWHGAFALALGENRNEREAIRFASAVAALKCTRFGGREGIPDREATENFLREAA